MKGNYSENIKKIAVLSGETAFGKR